MGTGVASWTKVRGVARAAANSPSSATATTENRTIVRRMAGPSSGGYLAAVEAERRDYRQRSPLIHGQHAGMNGRSHASKGVFKRGIFSTEGKREDASAWYGSGSVTQYQDACCARHAPVI